MGKRNLNLDLIAFKKNLVVVENLNAIDVTKMSKEELIEHFAKVPSVVALQNEFMNLGYMIEPNVLACMTEDEAVRISKNIIPYAKEFLGANNTYVPLYPGFPAQVQDMTEFELLVDQLLHYASLGSWVPSVPEKYKALKSAEAYETPSLVKLKGIVPVKVTDIFYSIVGSVNSITEFDRRAAEWFLDNMEDKLDLTVEIPFKETLCMFLAKYPKLVEGSSVTITDILRTVVYTQGGDLTLPPLPAKMVNEGSYWTKKMVPNPARENFKFKKMSRELRRYWLHLIDEKIIKKGLKPCVMDGKKYIGRWIRLGEILHPGQYKTRYSNAAKFFDALRNNSSDFKTWNSEIMDLYKKVGSKKDECDLREIIKKVSERPGEFIRRFDSLYRRADNKSKEFLISTMMNLQGASAKTLIELFTHIDKRTGNLPRFVKIPGSRKQTSLPILPPLSDKAVQEIKGSILKALVNTLSKKSSWEGKKVVIDEQLHSMFFPTDMRSLSEGKITVSRGTKIPFESIGPKGQDTVRFYTHWYDAHGNVDLDLHAFFVDESFTKSVNIGWNADKNTQYAVFSGDVRYRRGHVAEYIDVRVANALADGWRYVLINLNSFSGHKFKDVEGSFGWTYRKNPEQGLTWSPEQVVQQMNLTSDAKNTVCALIDLKDGWVKVIDYDYDGIPIANLRGNINAAYCQFYAKDPELNVELILKLNAGARKASEIMSLSDYEMWKDAELLHIKEMNKIREAEGKPLEEEVIDESNVIFFKYEDFLADYTKLLSLI